MILLSMTQERHERSLLLVFILNELFLLFIFRFTDFFELETILLLYGVAVFFWGGGRLGSLAVDSIGDNF